MVSRVIATAGAVVNRPRAPFVEGRAGGGHHAGMPQPPAEPAVPPRTSRPAMPWWQLLAGAWVGLPLAVFLLSAAVTSGLSCSTNGLAVILPCALAAWALGSGWAACCRARGWWPVLSAVGAGAIGTVAGFAGWGWAALERCFTF